jgi:hypothetical protein
MRTKTDNAAQGQADKKADKRVLSPFRGSPIVRLADPLFFAPSQAAGG